jgi:hypothetical protein
VPLLIGTLVTIVEIASAPAPVTSGLFSGLAVEVAATSALPVTSGLFLLPLLCLRLLLLLALAHLLVHAPLVLAVLHGLLLSALSLGLVVEVAGMSCGDPSTC